MPYQEHSATCLHCGAVFTSGDENLMICWPCVQNGHIGIALDCPACLRILQIERERSDKAPAFEVMRASEGMSPAEPSAVPPRRLRIYPGFERATPRPWRWSPIASDTLIADVPCPESHRKYYGGKVVCESIDREDGGLVLYAVNNLPARQELEAENIRLEAEVDRLGRLLADRARIFDECAAFDDAFESSLLAQGVSEAMLTRAMEDAQKAMEVADHTEENDDCGQ